MKDSKITKRLVYLSLIILAVNVLIFLVDRFAGFSILAYTVIFYFPIALIVSFVDFFYFKNKNNFFYIMVVLAVASFTLAKYLGQGII